MSPMHFFWLRLALVLWHRSSIAGYDRKHLGLGSKFFTEVLHVSSACWGGNVIGRSEILFPCSHGDTKLSTLALLQPNCNIVLSACCGDLVVVTIKYTPTVGVSIRFMEITAAVNDFTFLVHHCSKMGTCGLVCWGAFEDSTTLFCQGKLRIVLDFDRNHCQLFLRKLWEAWTHDKRISSKAAETRLWRHTDTHIEREICCRILELHPNGTLTAICIG